MEAMGKRNVRDKSEKCFHLFDSSTSKQIRINKSHTILMSDYFLENTNPKQINLDFGFFAVPFIVYPCLCAHQTFWEPEALLQSREQNNLEFLIYI
jgi:hypothetical protein